LYNLFMSFPELFLIAIGLSMDAFAVSIASGIFLRPFSWKKALKMAAFFGIFQALMPCAGWLAGFGFRNIISAYAPWVAFVLLFFIGANMIKESSESEEDDGKNRTSPFETKTLILLAVATSIDSLATGISFLGMSVPIVQATLLIGITTFSISLSGVKAGNAGLGFLGKKAEAAGGIVLIAIGARILIGHLF